MPRGFNRVILIGFLGSDPEVTISAARTTLVKFRLGTQESRKAADGSYKVITSWHHIVAFGVLSELMAEKLVKGDMISLEGRINYSKYKDKTGQWKYFVNIIADTFLMLRTKGGGGDSNSIDEADNDNDFDSSDSQAGG